MVTYHCVVGILGRDLETGRGVENDWHLAENWKKILESLLQRRTVVGKMMWGWGWGGRGNYFLRHRFSGAGALGEVRGVDGWADIYFPSIWCNDVYTVERNYPRLSSGSLLDWNKWRHRHPEIVLMAKKERRTRTRFSVYVETPCTRLSDILTPIVKEYSILVPLFGGRQIALIIIRQHREANCTDDEN